MSEWYCSKANRDDENSDDEWPSPPNDVEEDAEESLQADKYELGIRRYVAGGAG